MSRIAVPPYERVMAKVEQQGECLVFTGRLSRSGYGRTSEQVNGRTKDRWARSPSASARQDLTRWESLTDDGVARGQRAAQTWRNGLAGFVTLLLSALVLKGSDLPAVPQPYRTIAVIGCLGGVSLAIAGLWQTLRAEAPAESQLSFSTVITKHGSITAFEQSLAVDSQNALRRARGLVLAALVLLVGGVAAWWLSPAVTPDTTKVEVRWSGGDQDHVVCGTLVPTGPQQIAVRPNATTDPVTIKLAEVLTVTASTCT